MTNPAALRIKILLALTAVFAFIFLFACSDKKIETAVSAT
jgi:hypothetical protein